MTQLLDIKVIGYEKAGSETDLVHKNKKYKYVRCKT